MIGGWSEGRWGEPPSGQAGALGPASGIPLRPLLEPALSLVKVPEDPDRKVLRFTIDLEDTEQAIYDVHGCDDGNFGGIASVSGKCL